jgi:hypothetical protein
MDEERRRLVQVTAGVHAEMVVGRSAAATEEVNVFSRAHNVV